MHAGRVIEALKSRIGDQELADTDLRLSNLGRILDGYET
jgi:hypothetical protein